MGAAIASGVINPATRRSSVENSEAGATATATAASWLAGCPAEVADAPAHAADITPAHATTIAEREDKPRESVKVRNVEKRRTMIDRERGERVKRDERMVETDVVVASEGVNEAEPLLVAIFTPNNGIPWRNSPIALRACIDAHDEEEPPGSMGSSPVEKTLSLVDSRP
ncbi:hypothetical protein [Pendulispora albinea]|uniref:Uncharacterized protein n=1 Tax=Pendulispora albinea TaxID=2741071 RepID=A0ABZ2M3H5_9BACT